MQLFKTLAAGAAAAAVLGAGAASASVLYTNGPINGTINAYNISDGFAVSDSFTLTSASTVTGVDFGAWNFHYDSTTSVDWSISTASGGGTPVSAGVASVYQFTNGLGFDINQDSFSTGSVNLKAGTYYLTLQSAASVGGNPVYWDQNGGPSTAYQYNGLGVIPSESFDILGSGVPEPSTWAMMLLGAGLMGAVLRGHARASRRLASLSA